MPHLPSSLMAFELCHVPMCYMTGVKKAVDSLQQSFYA